MSRHCPNCSAKLGLPVFLIPRSLFEYRCASCGIGMEFNGMLWWGLELAYLIITLAIYQAVEGNWVECLVALPFAVAIMVLQYRYARLEVNGPPR
jgi:hypothetical protein